MTLSRGVPRPPSRREAARLSGDATGLSGRNGWRGRGGRASGFRVKYRESENSHERALGGSDRDAPFSLSALRLPDS
jgi:hypothetical protein